MMDVTVEDRKRSLGKARPIESAYVVEIWWRRRELNPRPKKPAVQRLRVYPILFFKQLSKESAKARARLARLISAHGYGQKPGTYPAK